MAPPLLLIAADMYAQRKTVNANVSITGIGLHSGIYTKVELHPAHAGSGITFVRADLGGLRIPALQASTTALDYATTVGRDDVSVGTVEHLLSAIVACGLTDVDIHIDGPEVPIVDGSAVPFVHLIDAAGIRPLNAEVPVLRLRETIELIDGDKSIRIVPANRLIIKYKIDFKHAAIGRQSFRFDFDHDNFLQKIAPARTFGFLRDVEKMRQAGLARGGSVENCIVLDDRGTVNGPLRFRDEFVRHKILDLIGDLALVGRPIVGEITAYRAGHALHSRFVERILAAAAAQENEVMVPYHTGTAESFA
ncbi:MAG: UDP-3-O-[3-hydroxymyristoyl] N-acetylglucosamine deacetylase [Acidobacteria bacterium]|nr:UDP-3-O-[3-hydroxymyristoyl] N-acetylglucosamine deacetylase [Acidobacteriota bacterium]